MAPTRYRVSPLANRIGGGKDMHLYAYYMQNFEYV